MSHSPLISVVIPLFNYERFVEECVSSVLNQSHENIQVIVVDNASTDSGPERVSRIKDPRLQLLQIDVNEGIGKALNAGFEVARGEWVAYLPADDYWEPEFASELLSAGQEDDAGLVGCWLRMVDEHGNADPSAARQFEVANNHSSIEITDFRQFRWENPFAANTFLWRADILSQCTPLHENLIPCDWGMLIRAAATECRSRVVTKKLLNCRWHGENLGTTMNQRDYRIEFFFVHLAEYRRIAHKLSSDSSREIAECHSELVSRLFDYFDEPDLICRLINASEFGYEAGSNWPSPAKFKEWIDSPIPDGDIHLASLRYLAELGIEKETRRRKKQSKKANQFFRRLMPELNPPS